MDALIPLYKTHHLCPSAESISHTYYNTESGSKLRLYIARSLAHMILSTDGNGDNTMKWVWDNMSENQELGIEVLAELRGRDGVYVADPEDADPCEYHWHGPKFLCPTKMY